MQVKAVLFDCDGTLVDSEYAHYLSWKKALESVGMDFSLQEYYPYIGKPADLNAFLLAKRSGKDCSDSILQTKRAHYNALCAEKLPSITATVDFLKLLAAEKRKLGIKLGVCSAAGKKDICTHLHHLGISHFLDIILSGQEDLCGYTDPEGVNKPKPYIYLEALKQLEVEANECIVIEDSDSGVQAAISAGCFAIAVPNIYTRMQDLSRADLCIESFAGMDLTSFFQIVSGLEKSRINQ